MAIQSGTHVGPYEIVSAIGAGGMGEVYRARDPKLSRDVAIKVLPEAFARDAARMERFRREAKILPSLNHSNIAPIYGLEDSDTIRALVDAEDTRLHRNVALTFLPDDVAQDAKALARFQREAQAATRHKQEDGNSKY